MVEDGGRAETIDFQEATPVTPDERKDADSVSTDRNTEKVRIVENVDVYLGFQQKIALTGAALTIIGAFLPWATVLGQRIHGIDGDGSLTLIVGFIAGGIVALRPWERRVRIASVALGSIIAFIALYDMTGVAGSGIYLTLIGGLALLYPGAKEMIQS